ncbi:hypothetical protein CSQ96_22530 [Janthinobacterium sp. BJB412]|nr:hypothetical protein CSQ96_22530 [Janthinobacterium sp. BJB412]
MLAPTLHKTLLAGLSRAPLAPGAGAPTALTGLLAAVPEELRLWHTVAASDLWQRAGYLPPAPAPSAQPACPSEPTCSRAAEQVLLSILHGIHPELLGSWLAQAQTLNRQLPHSCLVPLLDLASQKPPLRAAVAALLGRRGRWLAAQQPRWAEVVGVDVRDGDGGGVDEDIGSAGGSGSGPAGGQANGMVARHWQLGNLAQRCAALRTMRLADPEAARLALEQDWAQEPAEHRMALLPCLAVGLNLRDETFLERALDDKRKDVRGTAQQLLATLPGSQLSERCKSRLAALFTLERRSGLRARLGAILSGNTGEPLPQLQVQLPAACDKDMQRDGIGVLGHAGMGEKAGWLLDLMACVPPTHWSETWQLTPDQVVDVLVAQEFNMALLTGLVHAAGRAVQTQPDAAAIDWFVTLVSGNGLAWSKLQIPALLLPELPCLPAAEQERVVRRWLEQAASQPQAYVHALAWAEQGADQCAKVLSPEMSHALLRHGQRQMAADERPDYSSRGDFAILAKVLDCADLAYARSNWPGDDWPHWPQWRPLVDHLMDTLHFRHTMHASFLENDA